MNALAFALAAGFLLSIPVGPLASLVIRRTLARGFVAGLAAGAGVALADAIYGALGMAGATAPFAVALASGPARALAGLALVGLGIVLLRAPVAFSEARASPAAERAASFAAAFALAIANPGAIAIVAAAAAAARVPAIAPAGYAASLAALFAGAMLWWALLAALVVRARGRLNAGAVRALNAVTGGIAILGGLATIVAAIARVRSG